MKLKKQEINKMIGILEKIDNIFDTYENIQLVFPLDLESHATDEFGIAVTQYKAETFYGNTLMPLLTTDGYLAYTQTTNLFSFNLNEYLEVMPVDITEDEKAYITQYECCLVKNENKFSCSKQIDTKKNR